MSENREKEAFTNFMHAYMGHGLGGGDVAVHNVFDAIQYWMRVHGEDAGPRHERFEDGMRKIHDVCVAQDNADNRIDEMAEQVEELQKMKEQVEFLLRESMKQIIRFQALEAQCKDFERRIQVAAEIFEIFREWKERVGG